MSDRCIACGSADLFHEWSLTSTFFAVRAMQAQPEIIDFVGCRSCGTRHFNVPVTDEHLARLYANYRGEEYFRQRHRYEPWYTREVNDGMGGEQEMEQRRQAMLAALQSAGVSDNFNAVLDHGGDRGQMLKGLHAPRMATYEISGVHADPGVESVTAEDMGSSAWDLILCCHVLEHQICPGKYIGELLGLGRQGTVFFIEVPNELTARTPFNATAMQRRWLEFLCKRPLLLKTFDFISTSVRYRLGRVLPFLFWPLREHLTFFSVSGIRALLTNSGYDVLAAGVLRTGHIGVVARKRGAGTGDP